MKRRAKTVEPDSWRSKVVRVIAEIAEGLSGAEARKKHGLGNGKFFDVLREDEELRDAYARARESKGEACIDRIEEIELALANGKIDPSAARVLIDAEKWKASKYYPRMYGDKAELNMNVRSFSLFEKSVEEKAAKYADPE